MPLSIILLASPSSLNPTISRGGIDVLSAWRWSRFRLASTLASVEELSDWRGSLAGAEVGKAKTTERWHSKRAKVRKASGRRSVGERDGNDSTGAWFLQVTAKETWQVEMRPTQGRTPLHTEPEWLVLQKMRLYTIYRDGWDDERGNQCKEFKLAIQRKTWRLTGSVGICWQLEQKCIK